MPEIMGTAAKRRQHLDFLKSRNLSMPHLPPSEHPLVGPRGGLQLGSIPGYTGFIPGRTSETVYASTHTEASHVSAGSCLARSGQPRHLSCPLRKKVECVMMNQGQAYAHSGMDTGSMSCKVGGLFDGGAPPEVLTTFNNRRGHGRRSGADVPGYAGYIPGRKPGIAHAGSFARDNLAATEMRRFQDDTGHTHTVGREMDTCTELLKVGANRLKWPPNTTYTSLNSDHQRARSMPRSMSMSCPVDEGWTVYQPPSIASKLAGTSAVNGSTYK